MLDSLEITKDLNKVNIVILSQETNDLSVQPARFLHFRDRLKMSESNGLSFDMILPISEVSLGCGMMSIERLMYILFLLKAMEALRC